MFKVEAKNCKVEEILNEFGKDGYGLVNVISEKFMKIIIIIYI